MLLFSVSCFTIVLLQIIPSGNMLDQSLHELNRPYFCSTCFSNTQDQNYYCCFYFFKCCADARRGSRSTTPSPRYPGSSRMTFIIQNRNARPCSIDCKDARLSSDLCCSIQNSQNTHTSNPLDSSVGSFKTAVNVEVMELDAIDVPFHNISDQDLTLDKTKTDAVEGNTNKSSRHGVEGSDNPFSMSTKKVNLERKLFIPSSLAVDHIIEDDSHQRENWRKQGWFTKDILKYQENDS